MLSLSLYQHILLLYEQPCHLPPPTSHTLTPSRPHRSMVMIQMCYKYPILMDAAVAAMIRKGDRFLARWADIMTGRVTKFNLLYPDFVIVITYELIVLIIKRLLGIKVGDRGSAAKGLVDDKKKQ